MKRYFPIGLFALFALNMNLLSTAAHHAGEHTVLHVIVVKVTEGGADNYADTIAKKGMPIMERLSPDAEVRVWQATLAGDNVGTVVVTIEHSSLSAFAEAQEKADADSEWNEFIADLGKIREIVSDSLYREITK